MKHWVVGIILLTVTGMALCKSSTGQEKEILTPQTFIEQVKKFHPIAKQAFLLTENAAANLLTARGGFDPKVEMNAQQKSLDGVRYYQYTAPELKIPTPLGVELKAGFEKSSGQYINPELTNGVSSYLGAEISLLNGLLLDKRRATLRQAKLYRSQSEEERSAMINDLLLEAYTSYWQWAAAYQSYSIYNNYVDNATKRMRLVKLTYQNGDRSLADTVEAYTQLQSYQLLQSEALQELNNRTIDLSQYLWDENTQPHLLAEKFMPDTARLNTQDPLQNVEELTKQVPFLHPEAKTYQYKLQGLEVERKLKLQSFLPVVNLKANVLSKGYYNYKGLDGAYLDNNNKLGISIKMPLLLRQEQGEYRKVQIKTRETQLQLSQKIWALQNKVRQYYNEAVRLREQLQIASGIINNIAFLLKTEELRFSQGESSLFLINSRENKTLEMQQKLVQLRLKQIKAVYSIQWAAGVLQ
jgi:outer membrane protein TolC